MAAIVCNKSCPYRREVFCDKDILVVNQFGQCNIWYNKNGMPRTNFEHAGSGTPEQKKDETKP